MSEDKQPPWKPRHILSAEQLTGKSDISAKIFLDQIREQALDPRFPTPFCLLPEEVSEYVAVKQLPPERQAHMSTCEFCSSLVDSLNLDKNTFDQFAVVLKDVWAEEPTSSLWKRLGSPAFIWAASACSFAILIAGLFVGAGRLTQFGKLTANPPSPATPKTLPGVILVNGPGGSSDSLHLSVEVKSGVGLQEDSFNRVATGAAVIASTTEEKGNTEFRRLQLKNIFESYEKMTAAGSPMDIKSGEENHASSSNIKPPITVGFQDLSMINCAKLKQFATFPLKVEGSHAETTCRVRYLGASAIINLTDSTSYANLYANRLRESQGNPTTLSDPATGLIVNFDRNTYYAAMLPESPQGVTHTMSAGH